MHTWDTVFINKALWHEVKSNPNPTQILITAGTPTDNALVQYFPKNVRGHMEAFGAN